MMAVALLWFLLFGGSIPLPALAADTDLLPPNGFLQIWMKNGNSRIFTSSDLYGLIDGGAEIFLEFGFEQLTVQSYTPGAAAKSGADEFEVEIYRMADPVAATGIYLMSCGKESADPSFAERHNLNQFQLIFKRNRYYVIVNNSEGNEKLRSGMLDFARYIAARLPAETPVKLNELLPQRGLNKASIRLIRGPYALQSIYTLGAGDILQLGRKLTAVSGAYQDATGKYSLVLVDYPDEQAAQKALANVHGNLDSYLKVQEKNDRRLIFKDFNNEFGVVSISGKHLTIKLHLAKKPA
jgi:hypothetical protein